MNSTFFHQSVRIRMRKNQILAINSQNGWIEDAIGVKDVTPSIPYIYVLIIKGTRIQNYLIF